MSAAPTSPARSNRTRTTLPKSDGVCASCGPFTAEADARTARAGHRRRRHHRSPSAAQRPDRNRAAAAAAVDLWPRRPSPPVAVRSPVGGESERAGCERRAARHHHRADRLGGEREPGQGQRRRAGVGIRRRMRRVRRRDVDRDRRPVGGGRRAADRGRLTDLGERIEGRLGQRACPRLLIGEHRAVGSGGGTGTSGQSPSSPGSSSPGSSARRASDLAAMRAPPDLSWPGPSLAPWPSLVAASHCHLARHVRRRDGRPLEARNRLMRFAESGERIVEVEPKPVGSGFDCGGHPCGGGTRGGDRRRAGIIHGIVSDARRARVERIIHESFIGVRRAELEPLHTEAASPPRAIGPGHCPRWASLVAVARFRPCVAAHRPRPRRRAWWCHPGCAPRPRRAGGGA